MSNEKINFSTRRFQPAKRGGVEEGHWRAQDPHQHGAVQQGGSIECEDLAEESRAHDAEGLEEAERPVHPKIFVPRGDVRRGHWVPAPSREPDVGPHWEALEADVEETSNNGGNVSD